MKLPGLDGLAVKLGLVTVLGVSIAATGTVLWQHYSGLVNAKADLTAKAARLEEQLASQRAVSQALSGQVDAWKQASVAQGKALELQAAVQAQSNAYAREIKRVLSKHDLAADAKAKPALVEARINAGTERALRLLERASQPPSAGATSGGGAPASGTPGPVSGKP
jgi:hypothetical protein